jgi:formyltetrahydrofolate deformylase
MNGIVFLIQSSDQKGLVARISTFFYERGFNILNCQQYTDTIENRYFMRVMLDPSTLLTSRQDLEMDFAGFAQQFDMTWSVHYPDVLQRVAIMVTKASHCLYDLLLRQREGELACSIPVIVSNHTDLKHVADQFQIPFVHLPISADTKSFQETALLALLKEHDVDLIVLARYMQVLSSSFIESFGHGIINIHHAFLPAFQGANPYRRAWERGVKMIGATAHYATSDLDEGPIIDQDVERVTHESLPEELSRIGRDIERIVLARAVKSHLDHRVIVNGRRTILFT